MGTPPTKKCLRCGTENPSTMRFCGTCGADMHAQSPAGAPGPPPSRGFPVWGIWAIIGGVVAVAAVVTILVLTRDSDPVETTAPVVGPSESPQGSAVLDELEAYLPPEVTGCVDANNGGTPTEGLAEIVCGPASGETGVIGFTLYESPEAALAAYEAEVADEGVAFDSGDCAVDTEAEHGWSGDGGQGRIVCSLDDLGQGMIRWTSEGFPILGRVYVTSVAELTVPEAYAVWQGISDYTAQG